MRAREIPAAVREAIAMLEPIQTALEHHGRPTAGIVPALEARRAESLRLRLGEILEAVRRPRRRPCA